MKIKIKNLYLALRDQGPFKRAYVNFFVTGNAWGLFDKRSHVRDDGKEKVKYNTKDSANRAAENMKKKYSNHFSVYKCIYCDGYHLGKNRENK